MTVRQFEKKIAPVLEKYGKYNMKAHKVWRENNQIYFSVRFDPDTFRKEPWGVSAAFDRGGKLIRSTYGSRRDYMFTRILMKRIEDACLGDQSRE